jgi:hypothetical protein
MLSEGMLEGDSLVLWGYLANQGYLRAERLSRGIAAASAGRQRVAINMHGSLSSGNAGAAAHEELRPGMVKRCETGEVGMFYALPV